MCYECWEDAGAPKIDNPGVRFAAQLGEPVDPYGGCHIVRDDWNIDDGCLDFCYTHKTTTDSDRQWLNAMKILSKDERYSAMAIIDGFWIPAMPVE